MLCYKPISRNTMFYFKNYEVLFSDKIKEFLLCSPDGLAVNNQPAMQEMWVQSLGQEGHLDQGMATHPSILPGEPHGQRSLEGYSPWVHKESDMT